MSAPPIRIYAAYLLLALVASLSAWAAFSPRGRAGGWGRGFAESLPLTDGNRAVVGRIRGCMSELKARDRDLARALDSLGGERACIRRGTTPWQGEADRAALLAAKGRDVIREIRGAYRPDEVPLASLRIVDDVFCGQALPRLQKSLGDLAIARQACRGRY